MHPIDELSEEAKIAYRAFRDMNESKTAHFNCLTGIETAQKSGFGPSAGDIQALEDLLASHDKNVLAFKTAMAAVTDNDEKQTLIKLFS